MKFHDECVIFFMYIKHSPVPFKTNEKFSQFGVRSINIGILANKLRHENVTRRNLSF